MKIYKKIMQIFLLIFINTTSIAAVSISSENPNIVNISANNNIALKKTITKLIIPKPQINVASYVLVDSDSGKVIASKSLNQQREIASLTKLMTLYITFNELRNHIITLNQIVIVSQKAHNMNGSKMFLKDGQKVTIEQLIQGIIVDSGNDASVLLAQTIGGSEESFVNLMNQQAQELGMIDTHFTNPTGLPNVKSFSTAHDLAILTRAIIQHYSQYYHYFSKKWLVFNSIKQPNRNRLLWKYATADGLKTGHTEEAGYCLISSAKKNNMRLIAVVLGAKSDQQRTMASIHLLDYGFNYFKTVKLLSNELHIAKIRSFYGKQKYFIAGINKDLYLTMPKLYYKNAQLKVNIDRSMLAPVHRGISVGKINVIANNKVQVSQNIIALEDVKMTNILQQLIDYINYKIYNLWPFKKQLSTELILNINDDLMKEIKQKLHESA